MVSQKVQQGGYFIKLKCDSFWEQARHIITDVHGLAQHIITVVFLWSMGWLSSGVHL